MSQTKHKPTKAIILAAGFGTRMRPLSLGLPKPLMPFWGKPVLQHAIDLLASFGVKEIVINCHYEAAQIMDYIRRNPSSGLRLNISFEPEILGTGGALKKASWFFGKEPFWLYNADVISLPSPKPFFDLINKPKTIAVVWQQPKRGPRSVDVRSGLIENFISKNPGGENTSTFAGLQLIKPELLAFLANEDFSSIITAYQRAIKKGFKVRAVEKDWFWNDLGTPQQYIAAHAEVAAKKSLHRLTDPAVFKRHQRLIKDGQATGFVAADPRVKIHPKSALRDCIIWKDVTLGPKAKLNTVIISGPQKINHPSSLISVPAENMLSLSEIKAVKKIKLNSNACSIQVFEERGSDRSYYRLNDNQDSAILMRYSLDRTENGLFAQHSTYLRKCKVPVADIYHHDKQKHFMLIQDLGDLNLLAAAKGAKLKKQKQLYLKAVELTAQLHLKASRPPKGLTLQAPFNEALYDWERAYFSNHFLRQVLGWSENKSASFIQELKFISKKLLRVPQVMVHRDLQSTNIMLHKNSAYLIDFQGMRLGAAAYDLASLLLDPYLMLPIDLQKELLSEYVKLTGDKKTELLFWEAGIQRLMQALGAYGRLSQNPRTIRFKHYIQPGLSMLHQVLGEAKGLEKVTARLPKVI